MTSIPVAWLISIFALLLAAIVAWQFRLPLFPRLSFCVGLISIAQVAVFVGIRFQFNDPAFIVLQPYVAATTAPALWLGFYALTMQDGVPKVGTMLILGGTVIAAWVAIALPWPWTASVAVVLVNTFYAARLFAFLELPSERFMHIALPTYPTLRIAMVSCLAFLTLLVIVDTSVVVAGLAAGEAQAMAFLSRSAAIIVATICIGFVVGLALAIGADHQTNDKEEAHGGPQEQDEAIFEQLEALMAASALFCDPQLTVARLGRRLGVPARSVSSAVNRVTGENTSRYINRLRVNHACKLLETTSLSVTDVMLESGYLSKSSFNTDFRRITGQTPSDHRKRHKSGMIYKKTHRSAAGSRPNSNLDYSSKSIPCPNSSKSNGRAKRDIPELHM